MRFNNRNREAWSKGCAPVARAVQWGERGLGWMLGLALVSCLVVAHVRAQEFPLELNQDETKYNLLGELGLPISDDDADVGSNGQGPSAGLDDTGAHQWRGVATFGHVLQQFEDAADRPDDAKSSNDSGAVASFVLRRAAIGAPYLARTSSFLIGAVITPPEETEEGAPLAAGTTPEEYWFLEPDDKGAAYWSHHAGKLYAVEAGNLNVVWVKREKETLVPGDNTDTAKWLQVGNSYFRKYQKTYVVSGSAVKENQVIYWNSSPYTGPPVEIPSSRIGDVHFAYTSLVPEEVSHVVDADTGAITSDSADPLLTRTDPNYIRTIWAERSTVSFQIRAQNVEGRIFMEILGDPIGDTYEDEDGVEREIRTHLGFEIIDIRKLAVPDDQIVELGEIITPGNTDSGLVARAADPLSMAAFYHEHYATGIEEPTLYAIRETVNVNDLLLYWLIDGVEGIRWPELLVRYQLIWPGELSRYSHYVRPAVTTEQESIETAVQLNGEDSPVLEYQDPLDFPRAVLTDEGQFYTTLDTTYPSHRSLLRFNVDDNIVLERVYSWLDDGLLDTQEAHSGSVTNDSLGENAAPVFSVLEGSDIPYGNFEFDSQAFTVDAQLTLSSRGDFDRVLQLSVVEADGTVATVDLGLSISSDQPYPFLDVYGSPLSDVETENLNGSSAAGGLRYRADIMPVSATETDLSRWQSIIIGSASSSVAVNGAAAHYGILFRGNGQIQVFDGSSSVGTTPNYVSGPDRRGLFHRIDLLATGDDGNPFDGEGASLIDVYSAISPSPLHSFEKAAPGYGDNFFNQSTNGDSTVNGEGNLINLRVTRISDGTAFASGTDEFPLNTSTRVTFVGDGDRARIYVDGTLAGEGPNPVGVLGNVQSVVLGTDLDTNVQIESLRLITNPAGTSVPRVVYQTVEVGQRIEAPSGESGSGDDEDYLAGHINQEIGTSFHGTAYIDPLDRDNGFTLANGGAIIPVNAIPGENLLEIWWMRSNGADTANGFHTVYWPTVIGRYTIEWPAEPAEIVLASNDGSGALNSLQAKGSIYTQNTRANIGYNPNEEHALMSGGQAFALRDDLNVTSGENYTSEPYVLLDYTESDGRPAMVPFKVLREKPEDGVTFKFDLDAGLVLQAPMPLPLLPTPIPEGGDASLNTEIGGYEVSTTTVVNAGQGQVTLGASTAHTIVPYNIYAVQKSDLTDFRWLYVTSADYTTSEITGYASASIPRQLTPWELTAPNDPSATLRLGVPNHDGLTAGSTTVHLISEATQMVQTVVVEALGTEEEQPYIDLPISDTNQGNFALLLVLLIPDATVTGNQFNSWGLRRSLIPSGVADSDRRAFYTGFTRQDRKGNTWVYRGPHSDNDSPALDMQFYYATQTGFWFPELAAAEEDQPPTGTLTPYLRIRNADGSYQGDGIYALNQTTGDPENQGLPIAYRPVWPDEVSILSMAQTLTTTINGLPAIRGNSSLEILYEQSHVGGQESVVLHDSTREKEFYLGTTIEEGGVEYFLGEIPASAATQTYNGDVFFTGLPPHLENRFFFDPFRGTAGALVLRGEHRDETVGEDYVLLNVLSDQDVTTLKAVVPDDEVAETKASWDYAIDNLVASVDLFIEDPAVPGTYVSVSSIKTKLDSVDTDSPDEVYYEGTSLTDIGEAAEAAIAGLGEYHSGIERKAQDLVEIVNDDEAVDSYSLTAMGPGTGYVSLIAGDGEAFSAIDDPVSILILKVDSQLHPGELKIILSESPLAEKVTLQQVVDLASLTENYDVQWKTGAPVDGLAPAVDALSDDPGAGWLDMDASKFAEKVRSIVGDTADVQSLSDQHIIMRYQANLNTHASWVDDGEGGNSGWSEWTEPALVEGWIKRVLAGINPFNQRTSDLFNNAVDTDASMLTLAGPRWEGNVALNSDTIDDFGLIEIYETVLNRGRGLSIDADINYGPANDALLLAAGYINDLYMFLGNEALSDALNPTIGISTADGVFGDIATSLFAFKGQTATLLEEELALMRGRDDFLPPGVEANPVYNRLFWNYTRGIDSGEVIYALNYNIQEADTSNLDGVIDAEDAAVLYPQGHGDAYGHYLTAMKNYYSLLIDTDFEWVPRTEGVTILGQTVQVDYTDERKFAAAAVATAEAGKQAFDLTWRQDYESGDDVGWEHFGAEAVRENSSRGTTRYWGADHWASRTGQGALINWVAGNAMLPEVDLDPSHEGIQIIDRTTVPELGEMVDVVTELQTSVDSADSHLNPLGLSDSSMAFDVNPSTYSFWLGGNSSHFEQIYERAKVALNNAVVAFDDAKSVNELLRREADSQLAAESIVLNQEIAYTNALVELYGTPYTDDIGVGKTYATGYEGPDFTHYMYVDSNELSGPAVTPDSQTEFFVDIQDHSSDYLALSARDKVSVDFIQKFIPNVDVSELNSSYLSYTLDSHGFFGKPSDWTGRRESPGEIQLAISEIIKARNQAHSALRSQASLKYELDRMIEVYETLLEIDGEIDGHQSTIDARQTAIDLAQYQRELLDIGAEGARILVSDLGELTSGSAPEFFVAGFGVGFGIIGGDLSPAVDSSATLAKIAGNSIISASQAAGAGVLGRRVLNRREDIRDTLREEIDPLNDELVNLDAVLQIDVKLHQLQNQMHAINQALQELADARSRYDALVAKGNRLQAEREVFRKQTAATTQGFRTRDAAFRVFRDEKLERYNSLFNLAARYAFLAAQAYDYETGLLETDEGKSFIDRIVGSRALGVVEDGEPQFAGSNTGDPGLSSALAEMAADFQVLKGRLGLINPDVYGTTVSLRTENYRIRPGTDGDTVWRDELYRSRKANLLEDEDVVRHCLQIDKGDGLPVPGLIVEFSTEINDGYNLFGQPLAGGDHDFDISSFATKIFSVGVALEGYNGMDNPGSNASVTDSSSVSDPTAAFLDTATLAATPDVYLIPVGLDAMRSPALGDQSVIRTWSVDDVTIPLPFNIGASEFSSKKLYQAADSLPEDLFSIRKHQAFRPVSDASVFGQNAELLPSTYTNSRLIGRSVWNTKWKLVIPGRSLLNDPERGLDVLLDTLSDIKIHFETYSYAGN